MGIINLPSKNTSAGFLALAESILWLLRTEKVMETEASESVTVSSRAVAWTIACAVLTFRMGPPSLARGA